MILAIDPGNEYTAFCSIDINNFKPLSFNKISNDDFINYIKIEELSFKHVVCEMIASYGMGVGQTVFETCVFIGEIKNTIESMDIPFSLMYRQDIKINLCKSMRAKDSNIIQALVDRFAKDTPNKGKGCKADKGWFYGFKADIWQAYAVGVTYLDLTNQ